jgi:chaperonin GroEL (HSP60 family)
MEKYLVIRIDDGNDNYLVDNLNELIVEMYEQELFDNEFEVVKGWFFDNYKVFVSGSEIIELTEE